MAPILPMFSEAIYQDVVRGFNDNAPESIHLTEYPKENADNIDEQLMTDMAATMNINTLALSAREKVKIKIRQPLEMVRSSSLSGTPALGLSIRKDL